MDLAAADDKDSTAISPQETSKPLSKNAQKRQLRQQRNAATRADWKAKVREKKKLRRANRKVEEVDQQVAKPKNPIVQDEPIGEVIIDLAFENLMSSKVYNTWVIDFIIL